MRFFTTSVFALLVFLLPILNGTGLFAQVSGTKTIPIDYPTLAAAVTDLNTNGVGAGGATITFSGAYAETAPTGGFALGSTTLNASLSSSNPLLIQKGAGTVTLTSYTGGSATPASASPDGIFRLAGCDWVTIDGIDLVENVANTTNPSTMEYGYALFKSGAADGCQNATIKNCSITLNRVNNASGTSPMVDGSVGILVINATPTAATTSLTPSAASGTNSNNSFRANTIQNCNYGIVFSGYAAATPFTLGDTGNDVGGSAPGTGNTIKNYGGGGSSNPAAAVRVNNGWGMNVSYNTINNNDGGGVNHATTLRGIYLQAGTSASATVNNNTITLKSGATTSACYPIENAIGSTAASNTVSINNNVIQNCDYSTATSGVVYGIYNTSTAATVNINGNTFSNNVVAGTSTSAWIYNAATLSNLNVDNNQFLNCTRTGASGTQYGFYAGSPTNLSFSGNTIDGLSFTTAGSSGTIYGYYSFNSALNVTVSNNIIRNLATPATGVMYGIREFGSSGVKTIQNNQIYNFTSAGGAGLYGIYVSTGTTVDVSGNIIHDLTATAGTSNPAYGIWLSSGTTTSIYKNKIYNIAPGGSSSTVYGLHFSGGTTHNVYNNLVGQLTAPNASSAEAIRGISITSTTSSTTYNISFNSVYLSATSLGSNFGSSGIYHTTSATATTASLHLRNNVIVNLSTAAGTGLTVAYRRSSTTLTNYASTSNNNLLYAGSPSAANLIFYDGTNSDQLMAAYQARVSPRDAVSFSENPPFTSTTGSALDFLHMNTAIATQCESGGQPITGITDDFDGNTRNVSTPDVGADEFAGTGLDLTPPVITLAPLLNTSSTVNRTLNVTITDVSGVPTSGLGLPVLYWKINAGSYASATASFVSGNTYQFSFGTGVVLSDVVSYYIVAQDNATTPNLAASPSAGAGGFTANPPFCSSAPTSPYTYTIINSISGTFNVGSTGAYTTLTGAVADLNTKDMIGPVVFQLVDATYSSSETFPIVINANGGSTSTNTLTIKPATSVTATITGSSATSLVTLNGMDYVILDGSNSGGTSRDLTISNTNTISGTSCLLLTSVGAGQGATHNTIKNCVLQGGAVTSGVYGISIGAAAGSPGADNDNNTILNNDISKVYYGIYAAGTSANATGGMDDLTISNNIIGPAVSGATNTGFSGIWIANGLTLNIGGNTIQNLSTAVTNAGAIYLSSSVNGATIAQNTITGITSSYLSSGTSSITGLYLGTSVMNAAISRNLITGISNTNSGGYGARGMIVNTGSTASTVTIFNNSISDVSCYEDASSAYWPIGIDIESVGISVYFNSVNLFGSHAGYSSTAGASAALYVGSSANTLDIRNNIFSNTFDNSTSTGDKSYAVYSAVANTAYTNINYNDYFVSSSAPGVLGFLSTDQGTLPAWRTATGKDANSWNVDPLFSTNTNLHINSGLATTVLESGGTAISGITNDIDGDVRPGPTGSLNGGATAPDIGADEFDGVPGVAMTYVSSTTTQNSAIVGAGTTHNHIIGIAITTAGSISPLSVTSFSLNTTGTTSPSTDITNAKLFFTGASASFAPTTQFGTTVASPSGTYAITGSQLLAAGTNYFWVTYDIPSGATHNNLVDAECTSLTIGSAQTPTVTAPAGSRQILAYINTFPYTQDFEDASGAAPGWIKGINSGTVNDWVRATPAKTQLSAAHGGNKAFITGAVGNYSSSGDAYIQTPRFNLAAAVYDPTLKFWHNFKTENNWDAGILEVSTDGGSTWAKVDANLGTGSTFNTVLSTGWYNNNSSSGPIAPPKWSGGSTAYAGQSSGWIESKTILTGFAGKSDVRFRWRFGSDGSGEDEGWAIDDVTLLVEDITPPVISYTTLGNTASTLNRAFAGVAITDGAGVNTSGAHAPRVYYKKGGSTNQNLWNNNLSGTPGWKYMVANGTTSPFDFTLDMSKVEGGFVAFGDTIQYFVVAEDLAPTPNVGINAGTPTTLPTSVDMSSSFPMTGSINQYRIVSGISGVHHVGSLQASPYNSLTDAVNFLNSAIVTAPVTFILDDVSYTTSSETFPITILNNAGMSSTNTVTIKPNTSTTVGISGSASLLLDLNGVSYVTIDGSNSGSSSRDLTIENTNVAGAAVRLINGASDNIIKNCIVKGVGTTSSASAVLFAGPSVFSGCNNNTLQSCRISGGLTPTAFGVYFAGSTLSATGNTVMQCDVTDFSNSGIYFNNYYAGTTISGNTIFETTTQNTSLTGLYLDYAGGTTLIEGNHIYALNTAASGPTIRGLYFANSNSGDMIQVINNIINLEATSTTVDADVFAVDLFTNTGVTTNVYNNTIALRGSGITAGSSAGIYKHWTGTLDAQNNVISNARSNGSGTGKHYALWVTQSSYLTSTNSNYNNLQATGTGGYVGYDGTADRLNLSAWQTATSKDVYSLSGDPAFTSSTNLQPNVGSTNCWSLNGNGMPLALVSNDYSNNARSTTVATGPTDIGAYEFTPTVTPPSATGSGPPANLTTTTYSLFGRTLGALTWGSGGTVPSAIDFKHYSGSVPPPPLNGNYARGYATITATGGSGFSYNITFPYTPALLGAITLESNIIITKRDGGIWTPLGSVVNTTTKTVTATGLTSFSDFTFTDISNPLPVQLRSFSASLDGAQVDVRWKTVSELNTLRYVVERMSVGDPAWHDIGSVQAHGSVDTPTQYWFTDDRLPATGDLVYRLRMIDRDGTFRYSNEVRVSRSKVEGFRLYPTYPNPFNPQTTISFGLSEEQFVMVKVYDPSGREVETLLSQHMPSGMHTVNFFSKDYPSGVYRYMVIAGEQQRTGTMVLVR